MPGWWKSGIESIGALEAKDMLDRGEAVIVDVREPAELQTTGKVPGALNIARGAIEAQAQSAAPDFAPMLPKDKAIILYCGSGKRSDAAGRILRDLGYEKVLNLGGLKDWAEAGLPVDPGGS